MSAKGQKIEGVYRNFGGLKLKSQVLLFLQQSQKLLKYYYRVADMIACIRALRFGDKIGLISGLGHSEHFVLVIRCQR